MDYMPSATVIIPTYNRGKTLSKCIDSILQQDYPQDKFELIIIDDGSTDDTHELLKKYEKKPGFSYFFQKNKGPSSARNLGINNSRGEIICFIDDDCIAEKNWLKNIVKPFSDENVGGAGGKIIADAPQTLIEKYCEKSKFFEQARFIDVMVIGANAAYRRDILLALRGFDEFFRTGEDTDLGLQIRLKGKKLAYTSDAIIYHNHRSNYRSITKQMRGYGKGYASLNKKYTKNFRPWPRIRIQTYSLIRKIIVTHYKILTAFSKKDKTYYALEPFLDISITIANIMGLLEGTLNRQKYPGQQIHSELDFVKKANLPRGWGT